MSEKFNDDIPMVEISKPSLIYSVSILYGLFIFDLACRVGINVVFPDMQKELGLNDTEIGLLGSILMVGMVTFVMPFSYFADKVSKKKAVLCMSSLWGLGTIISGLSNSFISLVCGRFIVGMGNSGYVPVSISMLTSWFKRSLWSRVISLYNTSNGIGTALGTFLAGSAVAFYGNWRAGFAILAIPTIILIILAFFIKDANICVDEEENKVSTKTIISTIIKNTPLFLVCISVGIGFLAIMGNALWIPMFLSREMGWTASEIGQQISLVYLVTGFAGNILAGFILDYGCKISIRFRVIFPAIIYVLVAISFIYFFTHKNFLAIWFANFFYMMAPVASNTATQELVPAHFKSSALGFYVVFLQCVGALGPVFMGRISEIIGLQNAMIYAQGFLFLGAIFFILSSFSYKKQVDKVIAENAACSECVA